MTQIKKSTAAVKTDRKDGRRSLLLYLKPSLIKALKKAAVDSDRHAYEIAEDAFAAWLSQNPSTRSKI